MINFDGGSSMTNGGSADRQQLGGGQHLAHDGRSDDHRRHHLWDSPQPELHPPHLLGHAGGRTELSRSGTQDQIQARTGTEVLTGTIPTGYSLVDNATVSTTTSVTNNGELQLADGELIVGTGTTFTNSGSFDTTSANGILDGSTTTGSTFTTSSSGSFTVEGTLTIANNGSSPAVTNDGTTDRGEQRGDRTSPAAAP